MGETQYDQFLAEATMMCEPDSGHTMKPDVLYGLYTSWCCLNLHEPRPEQAFWAAMRRRIGPGTNGLRMKGAAAADYILRSSPALV